MSNKNYEFPLASFLRFQFIFFERKKAGHFLGHRTGYKCRKQKVVVTLLAVFRSGFSVFEIFWLFYGFRILTLMVNLRKRDNFVIDNNTLRIYI